MLDIWLDLLYYRGMKPYYQDHYVTIYHGDCREILPELPMVDLVLTDPPYPDQHLEYGKCDISFLKDMECRQLVFWSAKVEFPLDYTAVHIWDKRVGVGSMYERIFERNGQHQYKVFSAMPITCEYKAIRSADVWTGHKSQKPRHLIQKLVVLASMPGNILVDMFMGTGVVVEVAKKLNRKCIGIEIEEKYCEIAANRCRQMVMELEI